jgi:hypothetical protein
MGPEIWVLLLTLEEIELTIEDSKIIAGKQIEKK